VFVVTEPISMNRFASLDSLLSGRSAHLIIESVAAGVSLRTIPTRSSPEGRQYTTGPVVGSAARAARRRGGRHRYIGGGERLEVSPQSFGSSSPSRTHSLHRRPSASRSPRNSARNSRCMTSGARWRWYRPHPRPWVHETSGTVVRFGRFGWKRLFLYRFEDGAFKRKGRCCL
jgi:hypothetical protein